MKLLKISLFYLLLQFARSTPTDETTNEATLSRIRRDITGQYHPELHGDQAHRHDHSHEHEHSHAHTSSDAGLVELINLSPPGEKVVAGGGYYVPPPPPPTYEPTGSPNGYANCGCVPKSQCAPQVLAYMTTKAFKSLNNDVVCGNKYDMCCYDDPWPGPIVRYAADLSNCIFYAVHC